MSKVLVEEGNLTNIANAIRAKGNTTAVYKPGEMAAAISNLSTSTSTYVPTDEDLTFRNCKAQYLFAENQFSWIFDNYKDKKIRFTGDCYQMSNTFYKSEVEDLSNVIFEDCRGKNVRGVSLEDLLDYAKTKYPPEVKHCDITSLKSAFSQAQNLKYLPSFEDCIISRYYSERNVLEDMCHFAFSLEDVNFDASKGIELENPRYSFEDPLYGYIFTRCYKLKSIVFSLPMVQTSPITDQNQFQGFIQYCFRLRRLKFKNYLPSLQMKSQVIDMISKIGYRYGTDNPEYFLTDKEIKDDATYQALKNDPDAWTKNSEYSFYNHDSAVETINSLPDTSAYLAEKGGTNTIKFLGNSGAKTDGGAINTMTAEEIAVAAAKGWTVTFK